MPELTQAARLILHGSMISDSGLVRAANEDCAVYALPKGHGSGEGDRAILVVADGMGGHAAGEVASRIACDVLLDAFDDPVPADQLLARAIARANEAILAAAAAKAELRGMGTTLTALLVEHGQAWLGHVGDSRAYLWRKGILQQLSEDHSLVGELVRQGVLSPEAARTHPDKNVIFKALGSKRDPEPAVWRAGLALQDGDVLLLCSDGLTDLVPDRVIAAMLGGREPLEACRMLISQALAAGGHDNVTVGVFHVVAANNSTAAPPPTTRVPVEVVS